MAILDRFRDVSLGVSATAAGQNTTLTITFTLNHIQGLATSTAGSETGTGEWTCGAHGFWYKNGQKTQHSGCSGGARRRRAVAIGTVVLEQAVDIVVHLPLSTHDGRDYGTAGFGVRQGNLPYVLRPFDPTNVYPDVLGNPLTHTIAVRLHTGNKYPTGVPMEFEVEGISLPRTYGMTAPFQMILSSAQDGADKAVFAAGTRITNSYAPVFEQTMYYSESVETIYNASAPDMFTPDIMARVKAVDVDQAPGTSLVYSILQSSPAIGTQYFAVDSLTGDVSTKQALDYDTLEVSVFTLIIQATDASPPYGRASTSMVINVTGVNDHVPMFVYPGGLQYYAAVIHEHDATGALVLAVVAQDPDNGGDDAVTFSLETATNQFQIEPASGRITLSKQLLRESLPHVVLLATAADTRVAASGQQTKTTQVSVDVLEDKLLVEGKLSKSMTADFEPRKYEQFMQTVLCAGVRACPYHVVIYNVTNAGLGQGAVAGRRQRRSEEVRVAFYVREGTADPVKPQAIKFMSPDRVLASLENLEARQLLESAHAGYESLAYSDLQSRQTVNVGQDGSNADTTSAVLDWRIIFAIIAGLFLCCVLVLLVVVLLRRKRDNRTVLLHEHNRRQQSGTQQHFHPELSFAQWDAARVAQHSSALPGYGQLSAGRVSYIDPQPQYQYLHDAWGTHQPPYVHPHAGAYARPQSVATYADASSAPRWADAPRWMYQAHFGDQNQGLSSHPQRVQAGMLNGAPVVEYAISEPQMNRPDQSTWSRINFMDNWTTGGRPAASTNDRALTRTEIEMRNVLHEQDAAFMGRSFDNPLHTSASQASPREPLPSNSRWSLEPEQQRKLVLTPGRTAAPLR